MLYPASKRIGFALQAADGRIGKIKDSDVEARRHKHGGTPNHWSETSGAAREDQHS